MKFAALLCILALSACAPKSDRIRWTGRASIELPDPREAFRNPPMLLQTKMDHMVISAPAKINGASSFVLLPGQRVRVETDGQVYFATVEK